MRNSTWKPSKEDYLAALADQNPWHELGSVPSTLAYTRRRSLSDKLWRALTGELQRYQVVLGPRRVGKTVSIYQTIQSLVEHGIPHQRLWFMRMDHPLFQHYPLGGWVRSLVKQEKPTAEKPLYLFLDEINYSKGWGTWDYSRS